MKKFALRSCGVLLAIVLCACVAKTNRVGVASDEPFSDTETSSKDLMVVAEKMVGAMLGLPQFNNVSAAPVIALVDVQNETNEIMNKNLFIEKMRTMLLQHAAGRLVFVDRDIAQAIDAERSGKRSGDLTGQTGRTKFGADYFLTGKMSSIDKQAGGKRSTYTRYAFRLTDTETTAIVWEGDYEVKKVGSAGLYDR